jgi:hypothetical protein
MHEYLTLLSIPYPFLPCKNSELVHNSTLPVHITQDPQVPMPVLDLHNIYTRPLILSDTLAKRCIMLSV